MRRWSCQLNEVTRWISLKDWVAKLALDLHEAALVGHGFRPARWSVQVRIFRVPPQEGWFVQEVEDPTLPGGHWLTVEWEEGPEGRVSGGGSGAGGVRFEDENARRRWLCERLAEVLGAPGFDSSSRATVFRESVEGLVHEEVVRVLERLRADGVPIGEERLRSAQHRVNGILRTGPLKSRSQGAMKLLEIMNEVPLSQIQLVLLEEWKTQDDWLN